MFVEMMFARLYQAFRFLVWLVVQFLKITIPPVTDLLQGRSRKQPD